ncbi:RIO1-domain-containing protein [Tilletiaria anomala UBC 951]|uniref:Serine/threonine-protein kinase RIO1 n=1 Tax=Tilletiaria anomala (strain ATCC 24038 / CBS 436.72 / UBC 951) TaxID=1037660 RepID=A0A066VM62_TILAU|nr:RIO1-domain-containing protein [Tilletiaria anomala UBC 951]KDN39690.1 RIO1-domain-containing protein [Tilletiaria anomala UBC 951]
MSTAAAVTEAGGEFDDAPEDVGFSSLPGQQVKPGLYSNGVNGTSENLESAQLADPDLSDSQDEDDSDDGEGYESEKVREYFEYLRTRHSNDEEEEDEVEEAREEEAMGRVEDADWELSRGDFTKAFNRSRQADAVLRGTTWHHGASTTGALPAMNRRPAPLRAAKDIATEIIAGDAATGGASSAAVQVAQHKDKTSAQLAQLSARFSARLSLQERYDPSLSVGGRLGASVVPRKAIGEGHARVKDKSDRATNQQVLDPRTMLILFKMVQRGLLETINGVISTGKEANVYHAFTSVPEGSPEGTPPGSLALKIYKTSILVFKDRDRYVSGEFRFRHGYSRHNPRKMVRLWAEKEARNLKRLYAAGIRSPKVEELRDHVLVMEFLGKVDGWASPRLRDAESSIDAEEEQKQGRWEELYRELLAAMRIMYQHCRLVHADLSEYNVLYHNQHLYIIDVSQSVEHDHPRAFDFLRADLQHVDDYFSKHGVHTLGLRRSFEFIIREGETASGSSTHAASEVGRINSATDERDERRSGARKGGKAGLAQMMEGGEADEEALLDSLHKSKDGNAADRHQRADTSAAAATTAVVVQAKSTVPVIKSEHELELMQVIREMMDARDVQQEGESAQNVSSSESTSHPSTSHQGSAQPPPALTANEEAIFAQSYIPRTLNEVYDPERDVEVYTKKGAGELIYATATGMDRLPAVRTADGGVAQQSSRMTQANFEAGGTQSGPADEGADANSDTESDSDGDSQGSSREDSKEEGPRQPRGHRHEDRDAKKGRKKAVKEAAREKRKNKMPKKEKKARVKKSSGGK